MLNYDPKSKWPGFTKVNPFAPPPKCLHSPQKKQFVIIISHIYDL